MLLSMRLPSLVCLTLPSLFSTPFFSHRVKQVFSSPLVGMQCLGAPFHPMGSAGRGGYSMPSYLFFCSKIGWESVLFPISATHDKFIGSPNFFRIVSNISHYDQDGFSRVITVSGPRIESTFWIFFFPALSFSCLFFLPGVKRNVA